MHPPFRYFTLRRSSPSLLFFRLSHSSCSLFSRDSYSNPFISVALHYSLQYVHVSCPGESRTRHSTPACGLTSAQHRGKTPVKPLAKLCLTQHAIVLLYCKGTSLALGQLVVYVLFHKAAFQTVSPQDVVVMGLLFPRCRMLHFSLLSYMRCLPAHFSNLSRSL